MQPDLTSREAVWDGLWNHRSPGRIAVNVRPSVERIEASRAVVETLGLPDPGMPPAWREALLGDLAYWQACRQMPGDGFPSLNVPRFLHGHSQGLCDVFGANVEEQPDGNFFVHPLPPDPDRIVALEPRPPETSKYWGAVEYIRLAREATSALIPFRNPIMTGPFDTANYLLGSTVLLEWVYTEPEALQALIGRVTAVLGDMVHALREAAGGSLHAHHLTCTRGGNDYASECRSIVSVETYETFDAPYLYQLGERLGPYAIHSCGSWERTVASARRDPNLRAMNGQVKENDLAVLCAEAAGEVTFSIQPSANLPEWFLFESREEFFRYVLKRVPSGQPLELTIGEDELALWNQVCASCSRTECRI
ncbi:MAG: uroporphyrinogen decarboxylase family protein [Armatimonadota bacterium]